MADEIFPLKKIDDCEYHSADGRFSIIKNSDIKGGWKPLKHGWLVYEREHGENIYLAWARSIRKATDFIELISDEGIFL